MKDADSQGFGIGGEFMELLLIRHGETPSNHQGRHQGWNDTSLSQAGRHQASKCYEHLSHIDFDAIYSSDLNRAIETSKIIFKGRDSKINLDKRLREINVGRLSGMYISEAEKKYGEGYIKSIKERDFSDFEGESNAEFLERAMDLLNDMSEKSLNRVAVVTHGGTISAILSNIIKVPVFKVICIENCSITKLKKAEAAWKIFSVGSTQHLESF